MLRTAQLLREEAEVLDALVAAELDGSGDAPADAISLERLAELPPALRRLVVQQLADRTAGGPVAGAARHAEEVAGATPQRHGRCSTSAAVSAPSSSAACSVRRQARHERERGAQIWFPALSGARDEPAIGETLVSREELRRRVAELGARGQRGLHAAETCSWSAS